MKQSIYKVAVLMQDQAQCNRMKQLCIDNGLPTWEDDVAFEFYDNYKYFEFNNNEFLIGFNIMQHPLITESEFIELLKQEKA